MSFALNPVLREAVNIYWVEGQVFPAYFFYLVIFATLQLLWLILPTGESQFWVGPEYLFTFSSVAALLLMVYFSLRLADVEFVPWKFSSLRHWLQEEGLGVGTVASALLGVLAVHVMLLLLLSLPLLTWASAISRASLEATGFTAMLLFLYAVSYGVWGLVGLAMWEKKVDNRRVFVRWIFVCFLLFSYLLRESLNPIAFLLYRLGRLDMSQAGFYLGWQWTPSMVHFGFHLLVLTFSLGLLGWSLRRVKKGYA